MDYGVFNVRTDVNVCNCTRRCTDTIRESALKAVSGRKIPCRTGESNLRRRRAGPMLYQLSYIPTTSRANLFFFLLFIRKELNKTNVSEEAQIRSEKKVLMLHVIIDRTVS